MPDEMNVLEPLRIQSSPSRTAEVLMPARSLPAPGSVIAIATIDLAADDAGQPALLLLLVGQIPEVRADDVVLQAQRRAWPAELGELLVDRPR